MIVNLKNIKRINILTYAHCLFPCVNKKYVHIMHINLYAYIHIFKIYTHEYMNDQNNRSVACF